MSSNQLESLNALIDSPFIEAVQTSWRDLLGVSASIACAIHCAVMPMVIGYLPLLGLDFLAGESFHQWMALICFSVAIAAFVPGWRKHRRLLPASVGMLGLSIVAATAFFGDDACCATCESSVIAESTEPAAHTCTELCCHQENLDSPIAAASNATVIASSVSSASTQQAGFAFWFTPLGGCLLVAGHLLNHRSTCRCECCSPDAADLAGEEVA